MRKGKLAQHFEAPVFEAGDMPHFEINGSAEILADGCLGILHYDENSVRLNCGREIVEISGTGLTLHHLGEEEAMVRGKITAFRFI